MIGIRPSIEPDESEELSGLGWVGDKDFLKEERIMEEKKPAAKKQPAPKKEAAPKKFDLGAIVSDVQALYKKDARQMQMIKQGNEATRVYTINDGLPLSESNMIFQLFKLPVLPFNKIVQFAGNTDTGKSTESAITVADAHKAGWITVVWDAEDKFDMGRLIKLGGDPDMVILIKTNEILQGGEKVRKTIHSTKKKYPKANILIVWDSVGGSQSRSHAEKEMDNAKSAQPGQDAKENASVMKMLVGLFNKYPDSIAVYLANQVYAKIGMFQFGDAQSGGKKVEFHSSGIVVLKQVKRLTKVVDGVSMKYGIITKASVHKNHLSAGEMSVDELFFEITAGGCKVTANPFDKKAKASKASGSTKFVKVTDDESEDDEAPLEPEDDEA